VTVIVDRAGQRIQASVTPTMNERTGLGFAGWAEQTDILVGDLSPGLPAAKSGLRIGDQILSINDYPIRSSYTLHQVIRASGGKPIEVEYLRQGRRAKVTVQPVFSSIDGPHRWMIGVAPEPRRVYISLPLPQAFQESVRQNVDSAALIYRFLRGVIERRMSPKSIEGPIGIARVSSAMAREGPFAFFNWMAAVSLNLAVINLLPIPVLDGGVILMLLVEMFIRRDLSLKVKEAVFKLGFAFLLALMVFVLYNDIAKILPG
jgi:regulator of sigma E protease